MEKIVLLKYLATSDLKIILLDQNNYVEYLSVDDNAATIFNVLAISLNELFWLWYPNKLFSDLYLTKNF